MSHGNATATSNNDDESTTTTAGIIPSFDTNKNDLLPETDSLLRSVSVEKPVEVAMETDDCEMSDKGGDTDSGIIENMEIEPKSTVVQHEVSAEHQLKVILSKVLNVVWSEYCEGQYHLPNTAKNYLDELFDDQNLTVLISEVLIEAIQLFFNGTCSREKRHDSIDELFSAPLKKQKQSSIDSVEKMELDEPGGVSDRLVAIVDYFSSVFNRAETEKRSRRKNEKLNSMVPELMNDVQSQTIHYAILLLSGHLDGILPSEIVNLLEKQSPLLPLLYERSLNTDFLVQLMAVTYSSDSESFQTIFTSVLNNLFFDMQKACSSADIQADALEILRELCELKLPPNCNERPICKLIVNLPNFMPELCSEVPAREISRVTFLSPFLGLSIFADENPNFAEHHLADQKNNTEGFERMFAQTIQNKLDSTRTVLHAIFLALISNTESRAQTLSYLAKLLNINEKRVQYNADERNLTKDGYMLNFMSVLQHLSVKIKLDKIDAYYPYNPDALIKIRDDTKLRFTTQEFNDWLEELRKERKWETPKFVTQCWFLTLHTHHLGIIPTIQRYSKRLRAIKELQRMVDDLKNTKAQWEQTPLARRNQQFIDRWSHQIKKLTRARQASDIALIDPNVLRRVMQFYSTVCEYILYAMEDREIDGPFINQKSPPTLPPSKLFSALPEWYVEDIADFLLFCMQYSMDVVFECLDQSIITWLLTCVCAPQLIKNPYITAKLVEVLFVTSPTIQNGTHQLHGSVS